MSRSQRHDFIKYTTKHIYMSNYCGSRVEEKSVVAWNRTGVCVSHCWVAIMDTTGEGDDVDTLCLPSELLELTPSRKDGIPEEQEREYRSFACQLVQEAGILLRL